MAEEVVEVAEIDIVGIRMGDEPETKDEITDFLYYEDGQELQVSKGELVARLREGAKVYSMSAQGHRTPVILVDPPGREAFLRTKRDRHAGNNLSELPQF
jgi:hypothetical protein